MAQQDCGHEALRSSERRTLPSAHMRFVIYGAGGIGGSIGARLHLAGQEVVLIARGEHARVMRSKGMHFVSPKLDLVLRMPTVHHPREIDFHSRDVVILCMKSQHTESALRDLSQYVDDRTPIVCCQNGVANERMALRRFSYVYGMVVLVPAEHLRPGEVVNFADSKAGMLDAGRYPFGIDQTVKEITAAIDHAGFSSQPNEKIMRLKYSKLLANLNNAVQAVTGEGSREVSRLMREEALACFKVAGIECATTEENQLRRSGIVGGSVPGHERHGGSSLQSVMRGTGNIEADYLNGEIVQLGRLHGIPTPANTVVQRAANQLIKQNQSTGQTTIAELERLIGVESASSSSEPIS